MLGDVPPGAGPDQVDHVLGGVGHRQRQEPDHRLAVPEGLDDGPPTTDELGNLGEDVATENLSPWGERCEPEPPPVDDRPVLEVDLEVGIGLVEVHRGEA